MPNSPNKPKLSIITVVYNSKDLIEDTINSIASQTYDNIEYIVVDGASVDGTLDIIKRNSAKISRWVSSPDKGLYDAMNKGLELATGEYVWFINSGDLIYSKETASKIMDRDEKPADIYYGETEIIGTKKESIGLRRLHAPESLSWKSFKDGMLVCHQSIIVRKSIAPYYSLHFKHAADYEWVLKSLKKAQKIENTHLILSKFLDGGQSKQNIVKGLKERFKIMSEHYGFLPTLFRHFIIGTKFFIYLAKNKRF